MGLLFFFAEQLNVSSGMCKCVMSDVLVLRLKG